MSHLYLHEIAGFLLITPQSLIIEIQGLVFIILEEKHIFPYQLLFFPLGNTGPYFISMAQLLNVGTLPVKQNAAGVGDEVFQGFPCWSA